MGKGSGRAGHHCTEAEGLSLKISKTLIRASLSPFWKHSQVCSHTQLLTKGWEH